MTEPWERLQAALSGRNEVERLAYSPFHALEDDPPHARLLNRMGLTPRT
jgi:hypothetical protein